MISRETPSSARGNGTATNAYAVSMGLDLHRFFEATGIVLPVGFNFSQNTARPRYSAGDDIVDASVSGYLRELLGKIGHES